MRISTLRLLLCLIVMTSLSCRADIFGADVGVLTQILSENIQQLSELQSILQQSQNSLNLLEDINQGINDSLRAAHSLLGRADGRNLDHHQALAKFRDLYGSAVHSPDERTQTASDQVVIEASEMNDQISAYVAQLDRVGEDIKDYSHSVSPGGASKLTAQGVGVMIHVLNEQLRATGTLIKLSAQSEAVKNAQEKMATAQYLSQAEILAGRMRSEKIDFDFPRF